MKQQFQTGSARETEELGRKLGASLHGGEVIELIGDVGAGKTTLVRGLAAGLGSKDHVSSPTFTVCNRYTGKKLIHHCDFYRLTDDQLIMQELTELIGSETVVVLEWAEEVSAVIPKDGIKIYVQAGHENDRTFTVESPISLEIKR